MKNNNLIFSLFLFLFLFFFPFNFALGDVSKKENTFDKNEMVDDLMSAAKSRREHRMSGSKTQRISGDSGEASGGDGGGDSDP